MAIVLPVRNCPFCGVYLKPKNFERHIERVHPRYTAHAAKISIDPKECPICGSTNDLSKTKFGLPICNKHYVKEVRRFLIKDFYLQLKKKNTTELSANPDVAYCIVNLQLNAINSLLGWEPEKLRAEQFVVFNEVSAFTGYLLLRVIEAVPEMKEILYSFAESEKTMDMTKELAREVAKFTVMMSAEFDLFIATKFAASGFYDAAADSELSPTSVLIVPSLSKQSAKNLLLFLLRDANEHWHGTLRKILVPYGTSTAKDEFGTSFSFQRSQIEDHFETFKDIWNKVFNTNTRMTITDFKKLWDWLEWVVAPDGVTERNQEKGTYFKDYKGFGLQKGLVFEVFDDVLPEVDEECDLISLSRLSKPDPRLLSYFKLANLARGFRIRSNKGKAYYFPCRKWFYNKIMPVFIRFARKLELAGQSFEEDILSLSTFYSKAGIKLGGKSTLGVMIEPRLEKRPEDGLKTSRSVPWRILEKRFPINLEEDEVTAAIGKTGEIDLVVYANMNLYLLELKASNLESRHAVNYMREKAPNQCAKYAKWARNKEELDKFLQEHKIEKHQLKSVRIVICSSGVFQELWADCGKTGEHFAIVPEYGLFSTMAGRFTLSLKKPFPPRIDTIAPGIKIANEKVSKVMRADLDRTLGEKISEQLILWTELITFDRRQEYVKPKVDQQVVEAANFFGTTYIMNEQYLGDTISWVLPEPLLIDENQYRFFIGTQMGNMGTTFVCENCKSAIKYYWPKEENKESQKIQKVLGAKSCPLCGGTIRESKESKRIRGVMTMAMAKFKYENEMSFE